MSRDPFPDLAPHHAAFSVRDLREAIDFWCDIFGFEMDFETEIPPINAKLAFVRRGAFRLELFEVSGAADMPPARKRPNTDLETHGTKHLCFSVDDPQSVLEDLYERGVPIVGVMRGRGSGMKEEADPRVTPGDPRAPAMAFFFAEPSGALVEILRRADFAP